MKSMLYETKPFVIQAVFFGDANYDEVYKLVPRSLFVPVIYREADLDDAVVAKVYDFLHDTWVGVKKNQWVIKGLKGEYYPCDDDVFNAKYRPVK